uniref:(northern house mosquito) hypothetical protein n=1 Tax=Culex pipiens TaxID=7175 RepID=A0A8D8FVD6_CULPI
MLSRWTRRTPSPVDSPARTEILRHRSIDQRSPDRFTACWTHQSAGKRSTTCWISTLRCQKRKLSRIVFPYRRMPSAKSGHASITCYMIPKDFPAGKTTI